MNVWKNSCKRGPEESEYRDNKVDIGWNQLGQTPAIEIIMWTNAAE